LPSPGRLRASFTYEHALCAAQFDRPIDRRLCGRGGQVTAIAELAQSRELVANLTLREVRGKYKRTLLGQGWSLVNPLATMAIYTLVFGVLLKAGKGIKPGNHGITLFALWLLGGLLPWTFFSNSLTTGMTSLISNGNLIKKVYFPREVLVASTVLAFDVTFLTELLVYAVVLLAFGSFIFQWLPMVLLLVVLLTAFALGIALALSVANVYFRDTSHFVAIVMQLWFYATPIVYPDTLVRKLDAHFELVDGVRTFIPGHHILGFRPITLFRLNPMERFVEAFRDVFYYSRWPMGTTLLFCAASAAVSLGVGYCLFSRFEGRLAEEL
jgi:ABC-2 type transport system permease protein